MAWTVVSSALSWSHVARADDIGDGARSFDLAASCSPGAKLTCPCPNGGWGTQTCEPFGMLSFCACGSASGNLGIPHFSGWGHPPSTSHYRHRHSSGVGLLIGGSVTLAHAIASMTWGILRLENRGAEPLGAYLTATGGTAMLAGLPMSIVGIVFMATRSDARGAYSGEAAPWDGAPRLGLGPTGLMLAF